MVDQLDVDCWGLVFEWLELLAPGWRAIARGVCHAWRARLPDVRPLHVSDYADSPELLEWALESAAPLELVAHAASRRGHLSTLQDLARRCERLGSPLPAVQVCYLAAKRGDARALQWGWEQGSRDDVHHLVAVAAKSGDLSTLRLAVQLMPAAQDAKACPWIAWAGCGELLAAALAGGYPWNDMACTFAALRGHLDVLRQILASGQPMNWIGVWVAAVSCGHLAVLQWAAGHALAELQALDRICEYAAAGGQLGALRWLRQNGCQWDAWTLFAAASGGADSDLLQKMSKVGALHPPPWTLPEAPWLELMQWAVAEGCPLDVTACKTAAADRPKTLAWLSSVDDR